MPSDENRSFKVPELPPPPSPVKDPPNAQNWQWRHHNDQVDNFETRPDEFDPYPPEPLTDPVTSENPLQVDLCDSIRSPYSYLVVDRLAYLRSNFNVDVNIHVIFPVAVNSPGVAGSDHPSLKTGDVEGGFKEGGRWYKWADCLVDCVRVGEYLDMPFRHANPDPITQNHYPFLDTNKNYGHVPALDDQPWISWMVRLANAAQYHGKSLEFLLYTGPLIWGGQSDFWPADIPEAFNKTGLDYDEIIEDIRKSPEKYDALWEKGQLIAQESGHGGVPNMIFRGEPYFGQDRFDHLFSRLVQNGLTPRDEPISPIIPMPRRFPDYDLEVKYAKEDLAKRASR
jgi:2-hydroxychromene-2-carboxylate isomerase